MHTPNYSNEREALRKNGWVLLKNIFTPDEVERLREEARTYKANEQQGDLLSDDALQHVVVDERILHIARSMLQATPVYFGDSTATVHSIDNRISHGFHKDSADKDDSDAPDFRDEYTIIRIGIYLQDHARHSQGLIVRSGSHKHANTTKGKPVIVPSEPGDVIVWYLTTSHSGNAKRLRFFKNLVVADDSVNKLGHFLYYRMPSFMVAPQAAERISLFLTFGKDDHHLERYIKYLKGRSYAIEKWKHSHWKPSFLEQAKSKDIIIQNIPEEIKQNPDAYTGGGVYSPDY